MDRLLSTSTKRNRRCAYKLCTDPGGESYVTFKYTLSDGTTDTTIRYLPPDWSDLGPAGKREALLNLQADVFFDFFDEENFRRVDLLGSYKLLQTALAARDADVARLTSLLKNEPLHGNAAYITSVQYAAFKKKHAKPVRNSKELAQRKVEREMMDAYDAAVEAKRLAPAITVSGGEPITITLPRPEYVGQEITFVNSGKSYLGTWSTGLWSGGAVAESKPLTLETLNKAVDVMRKWNGG